MYGLCFIAQAKTLYKNSCVNEEDERADKLKKVFVKVLGDDPGEKADLDAPEDMEDYVEEVDDRPEAEIEKQKELDEADWKLNWNGITGNVIILISKMFCCCKGKENEN